MEFGLSLNMVNLNTQEPNRNRRESKYYWDELFELIPAAGFHRIELPYEPKWDFGGRSGVPLTARSINIKYENPERFMTVLQEKGIDQIAGIQYDPSMFFDGNTERFFGAFMHFGEQAVRFARDVRASVVTVTPAPCVGKLEYLRDQETSWEVWLDDFLKQAARTMNELSRIADECGVTLAVKNEFYSPLRGEAAAVWIEQMNPSILMDIDTAHLFIAGIDAVSFIRKHSSRIGSVHFTDTAFVDSGEAYKNIQPEFPAGAATQVFRDIGQGKIELKKVYEVLKEIGYNGDIICNNRQTRDEYRAMLRTRSHINNVILGKEGNKA